jgi:hypothetical protein
MLARVNVMQNRPCFMMLLSNYSSQMLFCLLRMQSIVPKGVPKSPSWQGARSGVFDTWRNPGGHAASQDEPLGVFCAQFHTAPGWSLATVGPGRLGHAAPASNTSTSVGNNASIMVFVFVF